MSTFQLTRSAVEWAQLFSAVDRCGIDFTNEDILPVAGSHRRALQLAVENCTPSNTTTRAAQLSHTNASDEGSVSLILSSQMKHQLNELTSNKDQLLKQLKEIDAILADHEDMLAEETLRGDQFYMLLDEESNIAQFVKSFISKTTSYVQAPPLATSLNMMCDAATSAKNSLTVMTSSTSDTDNTRENRTALSQRSVVSDQDRVIDGYLLKLSDIERIAIATPPAVHASAEDMSDAELLERLDLQAAEKDSLLECIRKEEEAIQSMRSPRFVDTSAVDLAREAARLQHSAESMHQQVSEKLLHHRTLHLEINNELDGILQLLGSPTSSSSTNCTTEVDADPPSCSLANALCSVQQKCLKLPELWRERNDLLREAPAWRLRMVPETTISFCRRRSRDGDEAQKESMSPASSSAASGAASGGGGGGGASMHKLDAENLDGNMFGMEQMLAGGDRDHEVCHRDSIARRAADFRSTFRAITSAGGVADCWSVDNTLGCLSAGVKLGSTGAGRHTEAEEEVETESEPTQRQEAKSTKQCRAERLTRDLLRLQHMAEKVDLFWTQGDSTCDNRGSSRRGGDVTTKALEEDNNLARLRDRLRECVEESADTKHELSRLDEQYSILSETEIALSWALKDRYESYAAAPALMHALHGLPPRRAISSSASASASVSFSAPLSFARASVSDERGGGTEYGGRNVASMTLVDIINEFREMNDVPLLPKQKVV